MLFSKKGECDEWSRSATDLSGSCPVRGVVRRRARARRCVRSEVGDQAPDHAALGRMEAGRQVLDRAYEARARSRQRDPDRVRSSGESWRSPSAAPPAPVTTKEAETA